MLFRLLKNEFIKELGRRGLIIFIFIIALIFVATPLINKISFGNVNYLTNVYDYTIKNLEDQNQTFSAIDDLDSKIKSEINKIEIHAYKYLKSNVKFTGDWRIDLTDNLIAKLKEVYVHKLVIDGVSVEEISRAVGTQGYSDIDFSKFYSSKEELIKSYDILKSEATKIQTLLNDSNYKDYYLSIIERDNKNVEVLKSKLNEFETKLKADPDNASIIKQINQTNNSIITLQENIKLSTFLSENDILAGSDEDIKWKLKAVERIKFNIEAITKEILTEEEYNKLPLAASTTYKNYYEDEMHYINKAKSTYKLNWESLKLNIPLIQNSVDSRTVNDYMISMLILITIIGVIVSSSIVSKEFSSGSIRLLLARPVKRWKVLLSKYISCLLIPIFIMILFVVLFLVSNGIINGFGAFSIPVLSISSGNVIETNYILYLLTEIAKTIPSMIFVITLSFTISVITRSTSVAAASSLAVIFLSVGVTGAMIGFDQLWISLTPIPYISTSIEGFLSGLPYTYSKHFNLGYGMICLILTAIILLIISIIKFNKSDIKN